VSRGMDRRSFVKGAALGLAAPSLLTALSGCGRDAELETRLADFYGDPTAAAEIGRAYLRVTPEEQDPEVLLEALAGADLDAWQELARRDPAALREAVRERHRADFDAGRTVRLHGWVLSHTEVRLAALTLP